MAVKIFICYAHQDVGMLKKLLAHLRPLQRDGLVDIWSDGTIIAGMEWEQEIKKHLNTAQIILLLISRDFMNSEYCFSVELKRAIEHHEQGEARVIPVILRPITWKIAPLDKLQALPQNAKPITDWITQDHGFHDVAEGINKAVNQLNIKPTPNHLIRQTSSSLPSHIPLEYRLQVWQREQIEQLKQEVPNLTVLSLLNLASERAGDWVSFDEVYKVAGCTKGQAQGYLSYFTQWIKQHFEQNKEGVWPVEVQADPLVKYRMPPNIARYWKEA